MTQECEGCHIHGTENLEKHLVCDRCLSIIHKTWRENKKLYSQLHKQNEKYKKALQTISMTFARSGKLSEIAQLALEDNERK